MSIEDDEKFYGDAKTYWEGITPTVDGMLGGFAKISPTDINGSHAFLRPLLVVSFHHDTIYDKSSLVSVYISDSASRRPCSHLSQPTGYRRNCYGRQSDLPEKYPMNLIKLSKHIASLSSIHHFWEHFP